MIEADISYGQLLPIPYAICELYANGKKVELGENTTFFKQIADTKNNKVHFEWHLRNPLTGQIYTQDIDYTFAILPENK